MPEVQAQGWPGQHCEVPLAHPAVASRHGSAELCRVGGGSARSTGRPAVSATRRAYRRLPGSASAARYPAQLRHADRTHDCSQPLHQRCHQEAGGRSGVNGHNARSGQTPRRCRPQRRRKSSQDPATPRPRKPTPLQTARWKAVQKAKRKGLSIRGIARELGIHRETVRKYIHAESPPMARPRNVGSTPAC